MFESTSRYFSIKTLTLSVTDSNGTSRQVRYIQRRFIPPAAGMTTLAEHTVVQGDRLDNITAQYLGDPQQFWRLCDASCAMVPDQLTATPGRLIRVPVPQF